jgi:LysM repeat protein
MFIPSNKCSKTFPKVVNGRSKTMSTMTINSVQISKTIDFQGFQANPSGRIKLNRRGRLARTLVVLSLAIVAASVAGGKAGADTTVAPVVAKSFITVTVAPGDTVWSLANRVSEGKNVRSLVAAIIEINSLDSVDVEAGQKIRIPLS